MDQKKRSRKVDGKMEEIHSSLGKCPTDVSSSTHRSEVQTVLCVQLHSGF
jgi:hypothetical protein